MFILRIVNAEVEVNVDTGRCSRMNPGNPSGGIPEKVFEGILEGIPLEISEEAFEAIPKGVPCSISEEIQ